MSYIEKLVTEIVIKILNKLTFRDKIEMSIVSDRILGIYFEHDYENIFDKLYGDFEFMNVPEGWILKYVNFLLAKKHTDSEYFRCPNSCMCSSFSEMLEEILFSHGSECQWHDYHEIIELLLHNKIKVDSKLLSNQYFLREYESDMNDPIVFD